MTAEVAILNNSAIAIAADSAVTIGLGKKIYNSALKVFALSKTAPVGVMVYGNAGLLDVPWETIVKMYRSQLGAKTFGTLDAYAVDLLNFLTKNRHLFPKDLQDNWVSSNITRFYTNIRDELSHEIASLLASNIPVTSQITQEAFQHIVSAKHAQLVDREFAAKVDASWELKFSKQIQKTTNNLQTEVFQNLPLEGNVVKQLHEIGVWLHTRNIMSDAHTGLVVCGFGEEDVYPALVTNLIDGVYADRLKYIFKADKSVHIKKDTNCSIIPFAQEDMVNTFMEGMNPSIDRFIRKWLAELFSQLPSLVPDDDLSGTPEERAAIRNKYAHTTEQLLQRFLEQLAIHKRRQHIDPILNMVGVLPKDELAAMAEAMVSLTAFKRRMTDELETVGGPIDVAVISKGDGFVWVKRKHYFEPSLNQHFFANYFRGLSDDQTQGR